MQYLSTGSFMEVCCDLFNIFKVSTFNYIHKIIDLMCEMKDDLIKSPHHNQFSNIEAQFRSKKGFPWRDWFRRCISNRNMSRKFTDPWNLLQWIRVSVTNYPGSLWARLRNIWFRFTRKNVYNFKCNLRFILRNVSAVSYIALRLALLFFSYLIK